ncbi:M4 family metallopeptidase [Leptolyngbya boryana CZ1]|uniref:Neutral metalloproteinase n=1 Tax=Leptolyngbya boryana CZ1 TaxID=3060204 RepID=A0AA97ALA5_LEPBY|nr:MULTISPECIES: M4 family metallopeptidase [Leptolyngbya]MBD1856497.1 M4 family metallopeptidase [Leptolyngbya sp. FACHB-1624]WNZ43868.1 M4 family metallopeptidase [Leptolyngbya boryana CZ1]
MRNRRQSRCRRRDQHICTICCIVPPHITDRIIINGTETQRDWALQNLRVSEQFRGRREVIGAAIQPFLVAANEKRRTIYNAANRTRLPGRIVRGETSPAVSDVAVNEAFDGSGAVYDFFKEVYERDSIDDYGMRLNSTVHYGQRYNNAFWNGSQMVYGDGDGELFNRFTISLDVIAHELTHGITQTEAGLVYQGQSGALNESFSDVFGVLVKQKVLNQTADQADWLIGAGLLTAKVNGEALRSMKAPGTAYDDRVLGKDPQPAEMKNLYKGTADNGGVHINSGIPNRAFYLVASALGGYAWEKAGKIWYIALTERLRTSSNFQDAARATATIASELYGIDSTEQQAVQNAWRTVGVI